MRAFLAADFEPPLKAGPLLDALRGRAGGGFRWVPPERVHLTLRFLGEIPDATAGPLGTALAKGLARTAGVEARTGALGAFPDARRARIVWLGLDGDFAPLLAALDGILAPFRFAWEERPFVPHLTLARHRGSGSDLTGLLAALPAPAPAVHRVTGVALVRSDLAPPAPRHSRLALARLGG